MLSFLVVKNNFRTANAFLHLQTKDEDEEEVMRSKTGKEQMVATEKSRTEDKTLSDSHLAQEPWTHGWNI